MKVGNKKICEDAPTRKFLSNLQKLRETQGYTYEELAQKIGVRPRTIRDYELQERRPVLVKLLKLAEILNYDLSRSLNYKYVHGRVSAITIRRQMQERELTPRRLSRMIGYSLHIVYGVLCWKKYLSLPCLEAIQQVVKKPPRIFLKAPQAEKAFTPSLLRRMRREAGLYQREIANWIGVSRRTISHYEHGEITPSAKKWVTLYELLKQVQVLRRKYSFKAGQSYRIYTPFRLGCPPQESREYEFMYECKRGAHHVFREKTGGWTRTYTESQLIGKVIQEV